MKTISICISFLFLSMYLCAQNFEGKIIYQTSYKSKTSKLTDKQLENLLGTKTVYYAKGGDYKTESSGTLGEWQLYINLDNKLYNKTPGSNVLSWNNGASYNDRVLSSKIKKNAIEVNGYKCHELILNCINGVQTYYYSDSFKIDYKLFEKHKYGNYDIYTEKAKAFPLRLKVENDFYIMELVAIEIVPEILSSDIFTIPGDLKINKKESQ